MKMRIIVHVKAGSKHDSIAEIGEKEYTVRVKAPAREGRANEAVIELLGGYFKRPKRNILIRRGETAKNKIIEIL